MKTRGGYRVDSRVQTLKDELVMEALVGANSPSVEVRQRTFEEIARIARKVADLLTHSGQPPMVAIAGA